MEKSWDTIVAPKVKVKSKRQDSRAEYYAYIKKLEQVIPDDELRDIGNNFVTKRKSVDWDNICRVVPAEWVYSPELLSMNKENNIYPEHVVKEKYHEIKNKIIRNRV